MWPATCVHIGCRRVGAILLLSVVAATISTATADSPCNTTACQKLELEYSTLQNQSCGAVLPLIPVLPAKDAGTFMSAYKNFSGNTSEAPVFEAAATLLSHKEVLTFLSLPDSFLSNSGLDFHMVRCTVLVQSTPAALAEFASRGNVEAKLVSQLLSDAVLMRDMLVAGGANGGKYGEAMDIWDKLIHASQVLGVAVLDEEAPSIWDDRSHKNILRRLALGTALEFAVPIKYMNADRYIDPVQRYLHYERAYLAGDLDPAFEVLTAFECRYVTNSPAFDGELAWLRQTLGNTRPDIVGGFGANNDTEQKWRYAMATRTDVRYGHSTWLSAVHNYSQIPAAGGECGPRAQFGRFARRAFGLPVWGMRQPGHACWTVWTPAGGWMVEQGATWSHGWWSDWGGPDFLLETQCREDRTVFQHVLRGQWAATARGEPLVDKTWTPRTPGKGYGTGGVWGALMLYLKKLTVNTTSPMPRIVGAATVPTKVGKLVARWPTQEPTPNVTINNGTIHIPAAAANVSGKNGSVYTVIMKSFDHGQQLCSRCVHARYNAGTVRAGDGASAVPANSPLGCDFEFAFAIAEQRTAFLEVNLSTWHVNQSLQLSVSTDTNVSVQDVGIAVPYTAGNWSCTAPVKIKLHTGTNRLRFTRGNSTRSVSIKELFLYP